MDIFATLIASAAQVDACRTAQSGANFTCPLSASGEFPATHYASSGFLPAIDVVALDGLCSITADDSAAPAVIAAAGLKIIASSHDV